VSSSWEKALHQWANAKAKLSTLNAGVAEDEHTMFVTSDVQRAVTEKELPFGIMLGRQKLWAEPELPYPKELHLLL
jgi:hypothetical protein